MSSEESRPVTPAGLPAGTMRVRMLVANSVGLPTRSLSIASCMVELFAVARTSAAEPWSSAATRSCEPWKSKETEASGWASVKAAAISS